MPFDEIRRLPLPRVPYGSSPLTRVSRVAAAAVLLMMGAFAASAQGPSGAEKTQNVPFTEEQQKELAEAKRLNTEVVRLFREGKYRDAIAPATRALEIRTRILGPEDPSTAVSVLNLAAQHRGLSDFLKAEPLYLRALAIREKALGADHPDTAGSLNGLASLYIQMGVSAKAEPLLLRVLQIREQALGPEHPDTAVVLTSLALVHKNKGEHAKAEVLYARALRIREKVLGVEHPDTAMSLCNLANIYEDRGQFAKAEPLYLRALAIREKAAEPENRDTAIVLNNIALLYEAKGDYAKAESYGLRALKIREKVFGPEHPDTARSLNNLGVIYGSMHDDARAEPLYVRALQIREKVLGPDHPDTALSLCNVAGELQARGDFAQAEQFLTRALKIREKALGPEHPATATSLNLLALLYDAKTDYARAEPFHLRALRIREKVLDADHPDLAISVSNLALHFDAMTDYAQAEPLHTRALRIREKALGPDHPETALCLNNLAMLYENLRDYERAEAYHLRSLQIREKVLGPEHPVTATCLNNLAGLYRTLGNYPQAEKLYARALQIREKVRGPEHLDTATSLNNLALILDRKGEYAEAERLYTRAHKIREKILGPEHPKTALCLNNLAMLCGARGDHDRAQGLMRQSVRAVRKHLNLAAEAQSERQQLLMQQDLRDRLDSWLSLAPKANVTPLEIYAEVLAWKGAVTTAQYRQRALRQTLASAGDKESLDNLVQLTQASRELATRVLAGPRAGEKAEDFGSSVAALSERKEQLDRRLSLSSAEYRGIFQQRERTPLDLAQALPRGSVVIDFLEYARFVYSPETNGHWSQEQSLAAFVVQRDAGGGATCQMIDLGPVQPLAEVVEAWRSHLQVGNREFDEAGAKLRALVWDKVAPHLGEAKSVLISPDGPLSRFPFAALPGKMVGTCLIEEGFQFTTLPVPQLLPELLATKADLAGEPALLVVGDVAYDADPGSPGGKPTKLPAPPLIAQSAPLIRSAPRDAQNRHWKPLAATGREIESVAALHREAFPRGDVRHLRGGESTEDQLRALARGRRYLHLATHGYFDAARLARSAAVVHENRERGILGSGEEVVGFHPDLLSGLVLAGANRSEGNAGDDGILTATEVASLDLRQTELAVLSACETGLGQRHTGEGLLGLQRSFQVAGARNVVASLWKVDDAATHALMQEFYANLWRRKLPPSEALRQAQLKLLIAYQPAAGTLRAGFDNQSLDEAALAAAREKIRPGERALPPFYWAAFVLSGR